MKAEIFSDGGSRGNPGEAAVGYVIKTNQGTLIFHGEPIGIATNNVAEYKAVISGLERAIGIGVTEATLYLDSQLVERQINGIYQVKNQDLLPLYKEAIKIAKEFQQLSIIHIKRELNKEADRMVNKALDTNEILDSVEKEESIDILAKVKKKSYDHSNLISILEELARHNISYEITTDDVSLQLSKKDYLQVVPFIDCLSLEMKKCKMKKLLIEVDVV